MQRIATTSAVADLNGPGKAGFIDGDVALGIVGTQISAGYLNAVQEELAAVVEAMGLTLDSADNTQLLQAIRIAIATLSRGMFAPEPTIPATMVVAISAGYLPGATTVTAVPAQATPAFVAPIPHPRIDRIVINRATGLISVVAGAPAANPAPPAIPAGTVPVAQVHLPIGATAVTAAMITDERDLPPLGLGACAYQAIGWGLEDDGAGGLRVKPSLGLGDNLIINGGFSINQRGYASGAALAAGIYAHDRWKAGAAGATYTYVQSGGPLTSVTITAGTLVQVVEDINNPGGTLTLSWTGTAQARLNGGAYGPSPITIAGLAVGSAVTIEIATGTVGGVKLEPGSTATAYRPRPHADEYRLCLRYCWAPVRPAGNTVNTSNITTTTYFTFTLPVPMRVAPSLSAIAAVANWTSTYNGANYAMTGGGAAYVMAANFISISFDSTGGLPANAAGCGSCGRAGPAFIASAEM